MAPRAVPSKPDPQGPCFNIWAFMVQNKFGGQRLPAVQRQGFISLCVFCSTVFTCETVAREATEVHTEKYCVQRARDCKCVFELFSPASRQRSEPGQKLIAAMFFSLQPHISTSTRYALMLQSSSDSLSVLINRKLVTKGSPHVTDVLSIMGKLRKEKHQSN